MKRLYVSGPISNPDPAIQERNVELGIGYADLLERAGYEVYCPHRELRSRAQAGAPYRELMKECLKALKDCDVAVFLEGWEDSKGAKEEHWYVDLLNRTRTRQIERIYDITTFLKGSW